MNKLFSLLIALLILAGCKAPAADNAETSGCQIPDTLTVGTLYSPQSFFIYRGDTLGVDFEMARALADSLHRPMKVIVARSMPRLIAMLDSGVVDLAAYPLPITSETAGRILPVGPEQLTQQVLIQRVNPGDSSAIRDVTDLPGHDIYVLAGTKYEQRLRNLDSELGGSLNILTLSPDSLAPEDLIEMVSQGEIPLTVLDSDLARLHGSYYANIASDVAISLDQRAAWAVAPGHKCLAEAINKWAAEAPEQSSRPELLKHYYQLGKLDKTTFGTIDFTDGTMSPFDDVFRRYAPQINWDWRMLAAQAYTESRFNPNARSFAGARGLMQIMPRTGRAYGLNDPSSPEQSVKAAVKYLDDLDRMFRSRVPDPEERRKFVIASYNAGQGHIFDAMRLAEKHGLNPQIWDENVEKAVLMLANPQHYNDNVVKYGYLRGRETYDYVDRIMTLYDVGRTAIPV